MKRPDPAAIRDAAHTAAIVCFALGAVHIAAQVLLGLMMGDLH